MPRNSGATNADALRKAGTIKGYLEKAGFSSIRIEEKQMKPVATVCVLGTRGARLSMTGLQQKDFRATYNCCRLSAAYQPIV
jgi:hypothetical protein